MLRVGVPIASTASGTDVLAPVDALSAFDGLFQVQLVGPTLEPVDVGIARIAPHEAVHSSPAYDIVVIPSIDASATAELGANDWLVPWIQHQRAAGAVLATWCAGTFVLARAGMLDGCSATTHWGVARQLSEEFPEINVEIERMIIDEDQVITAGGATALYLLVVHLVHRFGGPEIAAQGARTFLVDINWPDQRAYADLNAVLSDTEPMVAEAQRHVLDNIADPHSLESLAAQVGTSPKTLSRAFQRALDMSPWAFVQTARVQRAKDLLSTTDQSFESVTRHVGYRDPRSFRRLFLDLTGITPSEYRGRFQLPSPT